MICRPHRYEIGQKLLCFEPDNSKAKLIYFAKILKQIHSPNHNIPHYGVHFHGWKCKWDREVPEDLLLENNEFNRTLKRKIDEVARYVRGRYERKQRIDAILENAAVSGDDIDWDKVPGIWKGYSSKSSRYRSKASPVRCTTMTDLGVFKGNLLDGDEFFTNKLDRDDIKQFHFEQLQLPQSLRTILQTHCSSSMSSKCNYWYSVLQLLQCYVDNFPYNGFNISGGLNRCSAFGGVPSERVTRIMGPVYWQVDQNRLICAEVCSSLRILFDFTLNSHLLQPHEKPASIKNMNQFQQNGSAFNLDAIDPPTGAEPLYRFSSPRYELLPQVEAEKEPTLPCLNYSPHFLLRMIVILPDILEQMNLSSCRRAIVHRHLYLFLQYLDRTHSYWFKTTKPGSVKSEQASIKSSLRSTDRIPPSESSEDTEPLSNPELMRRETRHTPKHMQPLKIEPIDLPICLTASDSLITVEHSPIGQSYHHQIQQPISADSDLSSSSTKPTLRSSTRHTSNPVPSDDRPRTRRSQRLNDMVPIETKDPKSKSKLSMLGQSVNLSRTRGSSSSVSIELAASTQPVPKSMIQTSTRSASKRFSLRSDSKK